MPISPLSPELKKRDLFEQKLKFLEKHPPSDLMNAEGEFHSAEQAWKDYVEDHEKYAKVAEKLMPIRSKRFDAVYDRFQKAAGQLKRLRAEFNAAGILYRENEWQIQENLKKTNCNIEAIRIRQDQLPQLSAQTDRDSFTRLNHMREIKQSIQKDALLSPRRKEKLISEAEQCFQKNEERLFIEIDLKEFCYEKLKGESFSSRRSLFDGLKTRLTNLVIIEELNETYEKIEEQLFIDLELPKLSLSNHTEMIQKITDQYGNHESLCHRLIQKVTSSYELIKKEQQRANEIAPLYAEMKQKLAFQALIQLTAEQRKKLLQEIMGQLGSDYADLALKLNDYYDEVMQKIEDALKREKSVLEDFQEKSLKELPENKIEELLQQKLKIIDQLDNSLFDEKFYLRYNAQQIAQRAIFRRRLQNFPIQLWSLKTHTERQAALGKLSLEIPLVDQKNQLQREVQHLYRHTEIEIQLAQMSKALEAIQTEPLDFHLELPWEASFQEADCVLEKIRPKTQVLSQKWQALRKKHELVLKENLLIRQAVHECGALNLLSFESQQRVIPWIAQKQFASLRTQELLHMLGFEPLNHNMSGNFQVNAFEYEIGPRGMELLKSYTEEALKLFDAQKGQYSWLGRLIRQEMVENLKQLVKPSVNS